MSDMGLSPEALAMIVETSRAQAAREKERMAEWEAKRKAENEAIMARLKAEYKVMTPEEREAHDEKMKPKPPLEVRLPSDVTDEMIETADSLAWEDENGRIDWEMTIDRIDGWKSDDGQEWIFPDQLDDPVFEKIKRGVRKMRREG